MRTQCLIRNLVAAGAMLGAAACTTGGSNGDEGRVRFSQIVNHAEIEDLYAPVAVGSSLLIGLQHPSNVPFLTDPPTFTNLRVRAVPIEHDGAVSVAPLGFAQYAVVFNDPGRYRLIADDDGAVLDTITVEAKEVGTLRHAREILVTTTGTRASGGSCVSSQTIPNLDGFVLHANQSIHTSVIPESGDSPAVAMLGMLSLTARGPDHLLISAPLLRDAGLVNNFGIHQQQPTAGSATVVIKDHGSDEQLTLTFQTSTDNAPANCQ